MLADTPVDSGLEVLLDADLVEVVELDLMVTTGAFANADGLIAVCVDVMVGMLIDALVGILSGETSDVLP